MNTDTFWKTFESDPDLSCADCGSPQGRLEWNPGLEFGLLGSGKAQILHPHCAVGSNSSSSSGIVGEQHAVGLLCFCWYRFAEVFFEEVTWKSSLSCELGSCRASTDIYKVVVNLLSCLSSSLISAKFSSALWERIGALVISRCGEITEKNWNAQLGKAAGVLRGGRGCARHSPARLSHSCAKAPKYFETWF